LEISYGWLRKQRYEYIQVSSWCNFNKDLSKVHSLDLEDLKTVEEYVNNSWYDYEGDPKGGKQPWSGETKINYTGLNLLTNF
jgi:Ni,Fe-hydrogenase I large subunit